jgi:hypothetical protein
MKKYINIKELIKFLEVIFKKTNDQKLYAKFDNDDTKIELTFFKKHGLIEFELEI